MPTPAPETQFPGASLGQYPYWPVETHLNQVLGLSPVNYDAVTKANENLQNLIVNSPLNPWAKEKYATAMAQMKTQQSEAALSQQVVQDMINNPGKYKGLLGYRSGEGVTVVPKAQAAGWGYLGSGTGYGGSGVEEEQKKTGGEGDKQKTEQTQTNQQTTTAGATDVPAQGNAGGDLYNAVDYMRNHAAELGISNPNDVNINTVKLDPKTGDYMYGNTARIKGTYAHNFIPNMYPKTPAPQQGQTAQPDTSSVMPTLTDDNATHLYNQQNPQNQGSVTFNNGGYTIKHADGSTEFQDQNTFLRNYSEPSAAGGYNAGGMVRSPFAPNMAVNAPGPAMFMQQGGPVPDDPLQRAQMIAHPPQPMPMPQPNPAQAEAQMLAQWQQSTQGNTASAKAALEWAQNNIDTDIKRAVLMRGGGPGGQDAYAFYGKKGGVNIVPIMQMMRHGFAPEILAQNTTSHLSASPGPPPAAPQGPVRHMQEGGQVSNNPNPAQNLPSANPSPDQPQANQNQAQAPAAPPVSVVPMGPPQTGEGGKPLTGRDIAKIMGKPGAITEHFPGDVTHPAIQKIQFEANRPNSPIDSQGHTPFRNGPGDVNVTGTDGFIAASGGEYNSPQIALLLRGLINTGEINNMPKDKNGDPIIGTIGDGPLKQNILADMSHVNGPGEPNGIPYIRGGDADPYHENRMYAGSDHFMPVQTSEDEIAAKISAATGYPRAYINELSDGQKKAILYAHYRHDNVTNLPPDVAKNLDDQHNINMYVARINDLTHSMDESEYNLASSTMNKLQMVGGSLIPQGKDQKQPPQPLTQEQRAAALKDSHMTLDDPRLQKWIDLKQADDMLRYYISEKAAIDGTDKEHLLAAIGDPVFTNIGYKRQIQNFGNDQNINYKTAVKVAESNGYYVPAMYQNDIAHLYKHGRVWDPSWNPPAPAAGQGQGTPGTGFSTVSGQYTPPANLGTTEHPWPMIGKTRDEVTAIQKNAKKGTVLAAPDGTTYTVQ